MLVIQRVNDMTQQTKMHGMTGKKNALKTSKNKSVSFIHARCKTQDKALWVKSALSEKIKLTEWIIKELNKAAKNTL